MKKTKFTILFFLCAFSSFSQLDFGANKKYSREDSLRGNLSEYRSCYNVIRYDLDIKVDIENRFISGSNTIKFLAENDFQMMQIDLFSNMKIEKIVSENKELLFKRDCNAVFVSFPETILKGKEKSIVVYYSGNPTKAKNAPWDGGFSWDKDKDGNPFVGVSCQGTGASLWWPCKDNQT